MFKSVFLTAIRHLARHKAYTVTNVVGLTIGITGCLLVLLYVQFELTKGTDYEKSDRIYRVVSWSLNSNNERSYNRGADGRIGPAIKASIPEIEEVVRSHAHYPVRVRSSESVFDDLQIAVTDTSVLDVFKMELVSGDRSTALSAPAGILIAERVAKLVFGDLDPLGETLTVDHRLAGGEYTVTGVYKDPPRTVYALNFGMITAHRSSHQVVTAAWHNALMHTSWRPIQTFVLLRKDATIEQLSNQLDALNVAVNGEVWQGRSGYALQPLSRIHLYGAHDYPGIETYGSIAIVHTLASIAALVLLVACLNFVNLTTSQLTVREKEVAMRKLLGARRLHLASQILSESVLLTTGAGILSVLVAAYALPSFNSFVARPLSMEAASSTWILFGLLLLVVSGLAGIYPAIAMTRARPNSSLWTRNATGSSAFLRKLLVTFQFVVSLVLITSTLVLQEQINYLLSKNIGFETDLVMFIPTVIRNPKLHGHQNEIKRALERHPNVVETAFTMLIPGVNKHSEKVIPEGSPESVPMQMVYADEDFVDLLGIKIVAGRDFSLAIPSDSTDAFLLNVTAVRHLGWKIGGLDPNKNPLGKSLYWPAMNRRGHIVGIVGDFNIGSLREPVAPTVITIRRDKLFALLVKINPESVPETIESIKRTWQSFVPNGTFQFEFIDDAIARLYEDERRLGKVSMTFFVLAILIACLGLFALASFTAQLRTKEMGIRKVVGADIGSLFLLLTKGLLLPVMISCLIGWPIAYILMDNWLSDFAHRISLTPLPFAIGGIAICVAAFGTAGYRTLKVAQIKPVTALRSE